MLAVDFRIRTHNRPGFGLFDGHFERGQINFPQRPFRDDFIDALPVSFLIIRRVMFQGRADALRLNPLHERGGNLSR